MLEFEYAREFIEQSEALVAKHATQRVTRVLIKAGVFSGIDLARLRSEFDRLKADTVCAEATLEIETQRVRIYCRECHHEEEMDDLALECPACGSQRTAVVAGEEVYLMSVEME